MVLRLGGVERSHTSVLARSLAEPAGMAPPEAVPVNSSAVRVLWRPPLQPNGAVTGYHVYLNDHLRGSVDSSSGSYLLGELLPFTVYGVQVHAHARAHTRAHTKKSVACRDACFMLFSAYGVSGGGVYCLRVRAQ